MKPLFFCLCLAGLGELFANSTATANGPSYTGMGIGYPFLPFGFYQPYGVQYGSSTATPPYFALNPPVYYGSRYSRPYGLSPFAAPPMMSAPADYRGRAATSFVRPPLGNPYISESCGTGCANSPKQNHAKLASTATTVIGEIKVNPFAVQKAEQHRVAQR